jgi:cell division protein FtsW
MMGFDRTDRSLLGNWRASVDFWSLGAVFALALFGVVLSFAASPAVAEREHYASLHFVTRQLIFLVPALIALVGASMMSPKHVRSTAFLMLAAGLVLLLLTLVIGVDVKGARRWLDFGGLRLQASEFVKPAFVIALAYLLAEGRRRERIGPYVLAGALYLLVIVLLIREPDFGQATLITLTLGGIIFVAGVSWIWIALMGVAAIGGVGLAYLFIPHVTSRMDKFIHASPGAVPRGGVSDTFQIDRARDAIMHGGLTGVGPGEGIVKRVLPDAHADFAYAVGVEEFGVLLGLALILLFAFIVIRGLMRAYRDPDRFTRLAATGLFVMFGLQAFINMGVNVNMLPAKGMTLPFVSYGGSSLVATGLGMGLALALTRRRARGAYKPAAPPSAAPARKGFLGVWSLKGLRA